MTQSFEFVVAVEDQGRRLDEFLWARFASLSRMRIANLISYGACLLNGQAAKPGHRIATGDHIALRFEEGPPTSMRPEQIPLEIVYEDDHIITIVKPAGMLVHPTKSVKSGTLANALAYHLNKDFYDYSTPEDAQLRTPAHGQSHSIQRPGLVHRLDRATSGLMVVAKTKSALSRLTIHFRRKLVEKRYVALASGTVNDDEGAINAPIGRDSESLPHWWVRESGKEAETRFRVIERFSNATLVELEPVTGRTNQLRIHMAYSGHPIIGDELYFENQIAGTDRINIAGSHEKENAPATRLCLHAARLAFHHPATNEWMDFSAPLPQDFDALLDSLRNGH